MAVASAFLPLAGAAVGGLMSLFGGGPSRAQVNAQQQTTSMANALQSNYLQQFGQYENIAQQLNQNLNQELVQGENGQGLTSAQLAGLNTQALNNTGQNFKNAQIAAQTRGAGMGDNSGLTSGIQKQINASIASAGANALSNQQLSIQQMNANEALNKQQQALAGLSALSGQFQSGAFNASGQEASQNQLGMGEANQIQQEQQQQMAGIGGAIQSGISALGHILPSDDTQWGSNLGVNPGQTAVAINSGSYGTPTSVYSAPGAAPLIGTDTSFTNNLPPGI